MALEMVLYGCLAAVCLVVVLQMLRLLRSFQEYKAIEREIKSIPEVPGALPVFGHLFEMLKGPPWDIISQWVLDHGPIVRFSFFGNHIVGISDRDMLKRALQSKFQVYRKDTDTYAPFMCLLGTGLVTSEGELWRKQRMLISAAFRVDILSEVKNISKDATDRLASKLEAFRASSTAVELGEEFRKLTLQVIGEAVLSLAPEESDRVFPELYLPIVTEANLRTFYPYRKYLPLPATLRHNKAIAVLNAYVTDLINSRRSRFLQGDRPSDILDRILEAAAELEWGNDTVLQLRDEIKTFLFAGHETSSSMLTWTIYELSLPENAEHLAAVRAEADALFGKEGCKWGELNFEEVKKGLEYSSNCLKEALRKYSVVPLVTRELAEADEIAPGIVLPKGCKMIIPMQAVHRDERLWPNPDKYDPRRFEEKIDTYAFLPFIAGPRSCVGQYFALLETKIVLALLLQRFTFTPAPGNVGEKHSKQIPISPVDNLRMLVQ